jgi:hypothetical protein
VIWAFIKLNNTKCSEQDDSQDTKGFLIWILIFEACKTKLRIKESQQRPMGKSSATVTACILTNLQE